MKEVRRRARFGLKDNDLETLVGLLVRYIQQEFETLQWKHEIIRSGGRD